MKEVMTCSEVREFDRVAIEEIGLPGIVLMENAGIGCAEIAKSMCNNTGTVVIFCGGGNNGGDGYVVARHLHLSGIDVRVVVVCKEEKIQGDALVNLNVIKNMNLDVHFTEPADSMKISSMLSGTSLIVDAVFGTGLRGSIPEEYLPIINIINAMPNKVLAIDIPSGLDCDTGMSSGDAIEANTTATMVAKKQGFLNPDSKKYTGNVIVVGIGV